MKYKLTLWFGCMVLAGGSFFAGVASAQTKAYRQTNLASSSAGAAAVSAPELIDPWAVAYFPGQSFAIADGGAGTITLKDSTGSAEGSVRVPSALGMAGAAVPTGIASDGTGAFGRAGEPLQYVVVTRNGTIAGFSAPGGVAPAEATLQRDDSQTGAVYTSVALLHPPSGAPMAAVADFRDRSIRTFTTSFDPVEKPAFQDPNLPPGYAPYGMQVIGNQLFAAYALQNASKDGPVNGAGNGVVDVFDLQGNFVRRFAMGGSLNAPWGIALAGPNFGPFAGAILVGNFGDGTVSAFDAATGNFLGQLQDGNGNLLANPGIRGLTFRADGLADPNALYFTADINNGEGGIFGAITSGLVSVTRASASAASVNKGASLTVTVAAGPGNLGTPTGTVSVSSGGVLQSAAPVADGVATMMLPAAQMGSHAIKVQYSGDAKFVPSSAALMVNPAAVAGDFAVSANPGSVTVSRGQSAPVMITVTPSGGFTGSVNLSCTSVPGVTCSFGSATLSTVSGAASTTMMINTAMNVPVYGFLAPGGFGLGGLLAALTLLGFGVWRLHNVERARVPILGTALALTLCACLLILGGCGYGSSYTAPQNAGPAVMTITATSGSLSHTATVNVTVQ